ncbi:hypothetical protein BDU57DRAFT_580954 [Ampelomyces quisqualis]|uniref:Uncharacterized protein n=1 Tax=Ampelomyces quisqualis TaxID=50730 RepID=A0A6A5QAV7_AMPQU|nr:hypothetical protein BDU57DRAFT_580954 [Ampelomyces quisqualis]
MHTTSIPIFFLPHHVGLRDHRVSDGPNRIRKLGVIEELKTLGITAHIDKLPFSMNLKARLVVVSRYSVDPHLPSAGPDQTTHFLSSTLAIVQPALEQRVD